MRANMYLKSVGIVFYFLIFMIFPFFSCGQANKESENSVNIIEDKTAQKKSVDKPPVDIDNDYLDTMDVDRLVELLKGKDDHLRWRAYEKIIQIGPQAVDALSKVLSGSDTDAGQAAGMALGSIGGAEAISELNKTLQKGNDRARLWSAQALARLGDERAVEPLIEFLENDDVVIRRCAAISMGYFWDERSVKPLIHALKDTDMSVRVGAVNSLATLGFKESNEPILEALRNEKDIHGRAFMIGALGRIKYPSQNVIDVLISSLSDENKHIRQSAAISLASNKAISVNDLLLELLNSNKKQKSNAAAYTLGFLGDKRAESRFDRIWKEDPPDWVKVGIACGLVQIRNDREALDFLLKNTMNYQDNVFMSVFKALGKTKDPEVIETMINILKNEKAKGAHIFAMDALREITNLNFKRRESEWIKWFELEIRPAKEKKGEEAK